ncbi:hypothetical protein LCGC14_2801660, partial [marine sediment metagenome]
AEWNFENVIPRANVTVLFATGSTGKTTLAFQLQCAMAVEREWLGMKVARGRSIGFYTELNENEVHLKYRQVVDGMLGGSRGSEADLDEWMGLYPCLDAYEDMHLFRMVNDYGNKAIEGTPRLEWIEGEITSSNADLCILDSLYDFLGDLVEFVRPAVAHFLGGLHQISSRTGCAILVFGHPSQRGISEGHGYAGSTAWHDKPRSRIYLTREIDEVTQKASKIGVFRHLKNSWGPEIPDFNFTWDDASKTFVRLEDSDNQTLFLDILEALEEEGELPSPSLRAKSYIVTAILDHPMNTQRGKRQIHEAQAKNIYAKLRALGQVRIEEVAGKSRHKKTVVRSVRGRPQGDQRDPQNQDEIRF